MSGTKRKYKHHLYLCPCSLIQLFLCYQKKKHMAHHYRYLPHPGDSILITKIHIIDWRIIQGGQSTMQSKESVAERTHLGSQSTRILWQRVAVFCFSPIDLYNKASTGIFNRSPSIFASIRRLHPPTTPAISELLVKTRQRSICWWDQDHKRYVTLLTIYFNLFTSSLHTF